ncbi:MAG: hypothetical protein HYZ18_04790 [Pseudogulbenkiania sp.]|nr:hypothetical protein [Pseudogulbenkiania sp.]
MVATGRVASDAESLLGSTVTALDDQKKTLRLAETRHAAVLASGAAFASKGGVSKAVTLLGVELADYRQVVPLERKRVSGQIRLPNGTVMIGSELARELGLAPGSRLRVVAPSGAADSYSVTAVLDFGLKDLNRRWVLLPLRAVQSLLGYRLDISEIYLVTDDLFQAQAIAIAGMALNTDGTPLFPVALTLELFWVTSLVATVVGVLAAFAPALRAARLDPVEAIRG